MLNALPAAGQFQHYDIFTVNRWTGVNTPITFLSGQGEFNPAWAPTGDKIVHDVVKFKPDGSIDEQNLYITDVSFGTSMPLPGGEGGNDASWSWDGDLIAFDRAPMGDNSIYIVPASGGTPKLIVGDAIDPTWSPHGKHIAFHRPSTGALMVVEYISGMTTTIVDESAEPFWGLLAYADWQITYVNNGDVYNLKVDYDGTPLAAPVQVTTGSVYEGRPTYFLDPRYIEYHTDSAGTFDIWESFFTGGSPVFVTGSTMYGDFDPAGTPTAPLIAYARYNAEDIKEEGEPEKTTGQKDNAKAQTQFSSYPNPFNPTTTIRYDLVADAEVRLIVVDMLGRQVADLERGYRQAGRHDIQWQADHLPSGLYLAHLQIGADVVTERLLLMK